MVNNESITINIQYINNQSHILPFKSISIYVNNDVAILKLIITENTRFTGIIFHNLSNIIFYISFIQTPLKECPLFLMLDKKLHFKSGNLIIDFTYPNSAKIFCEKHSKQSSKNKSFIFR